MPHALQQKLDELRTRVRKLLLAYGACCTLALAIAITLACGLLDYSFRLQDRGLRTIISAVWLGCLGWASWRFLGRSLAARLPDVDLALKVEQAIPAMRDRLASSLQFLHQPEDDPHAGSPELRRQAIVQTSTDAATIDFLKIVKPRPVRQAAWACAAALALALATIAANPAAGAVALRRLAAPWGAAAWPQTNNLVIVNAVDRLGSGDTFEVEVQDANGAALPNDVRMHVRYEGENAREIEEDVPWINDSLIFRKENVSRSFEYAVAGGDDVTLEWRTLEIVEPPAIDELQVSLRFPAYTGWTERPSEPPVRAIVGARVAIAARTTKPLAAAFVSFEDGRSLAAQIAEDGFGFELPVSGDDARDFVVTGSGSYAFDLEGVDGYRSGAEARYEIRALEDRPPQIVLERPASHGYATPQANLPIVARASDDLAVHQVLLSYARSDRSDKPPLEVVLFAGPESWTPAENAPSEPAASPESMLVEGRLDLAALELPPGAELTLLASAIDYRPQRSESQPRRLTIVPLEDMLERLARQQELILNELARLLALERECRVQVGEAAGQVARVGQVRPQDVDQIKSAAANQRQVERGLTSDNEGAARAIDSLLADLADNRIDSPDLQRRMEELKSEIARLAREHLPVIDRDLAGSIKEAQIQQKERAAGATPDPAALANVLASAGDNQDEVIRTLERLLGDMADFDGFRRFYRELAQLAREQKQLAERTKAQAAQTLGKANDELTSQQKSDLAALAERQDQLAANFEKAQQRMNQLAAQEQAAAGQAAAALQDALAHAREANLGGQMRQAARQVAENQVEKAGGQHAKIDEGLQDLLDILANRRESELARLIKKLKEAEQQLAEMQNQQEELRQKFDEAAKQPMPDKRELERLTREQQRLQQEVDKLSRKLERMQADSAKASMASASDAMGKAGQQGEKGEGGEAAKQAEQAKKDLADAQKAVAERRRQAEEDLAAEQMAKLENALRSLLTQQQKLLDETRAYEGHKTQNGQLTDPQTQTVRDLSRQQRGLSEQTVEISQKMAGAAVFALALESAAAPMERAAERLAEIQTDGVTQRAEEQALRRLNRIVDSLKPPESKPKDPKDDNNKKKGEGAEGQPPKPPANQARALAELILMKLMQQDVQRRTAELDAEVRKAGEATPDQTREFDDLSAEQGRLADLMLDIELPPPEPAPNLDIDPAEIDVNPDRE